MTKGKSKAESIADEVMGTSASKLEDAATNAGIRLPEELTAALETGEDIFGGANYGDSEKDLEDTLSDDDSNSYLEEEIDNPKLATPSTADTGLRLISMVSGATIVAEKIAPKTYRKPMMVHPVAQQGGAPGKVSIQTLPLGAPFVAGLDTVVLDVVAWEAPLSSLDSSHKELISGWTQYATGLVV